MNKLLRTWIAALALLAGAGAFAQTPAGIVKSLTGEASIVSGGVARPAAVGAVLAIGDTVRTGANGSLGLTLRDNTLLSFGPSTSFALEEFLFAPAQGQLQLVGRIATGSLHYVSGAVARLKPQAVQIKTPTGIIGVRGTRFVAVVEE